MLVVVLHLSLENWQNRAVAVQGVKRKWPKLQDGHEECTDGEEDEAAEAKPSVF